ncbi:RNA methyltransferase [Henriciella marina]|uniref:RNA methyltransferase n=1 Tax=Henriciella marina TaxID=453851 RepID=UPI0003607EE7|nr:TrmH family RNA methyltransferase [Henriciella marina]
MTKDPVIILAEPQLGENIGATARAMLNFGLTELRIAAPRDGWPNPAAEPLSAGAFEAGVSVTTYDSVEAACADLGYLVAATARPRGMEKPVTNASGAVDLIAQQASSVGVMFGNEAQGLSNDHVALCDAIMTYPVNKAFASLNLSQAVIVFAHAWGEAAGQEGRFEGAQAGVSDVASREALFGMFEHFEYELERAGYFHPPDKTPLMTRNLRNAFIRGQWTTQEVRTFRGAVKALAIGRGKARIKRDD